MPPRSSSPICERSLDLTLIGIGRRDIPQCSSKHFHMEAFYRTFSGGQRPRTAAQLIDLAAERLLKWRFDGPCWQNDTDRKHFTMRVATASLGDRKSTRLN